MLLSSFNCEDSSSGTYAALWKLTGFQLMLTLLEIYVHIVSFRVLPHENHRSTLYTAVRSLLFQRRELLLHDRELETLNAKRFVTNWNLGKWEENIDPDVWCNNFSDIVWDIEWQIVKSISFYIPTQCSYPAAAAVKISSRRSLYRDPTYVPSNRKPVVQVRKYSGEEKNIEVNKDWNWLNVASFNMKQSGQDVGCRNSAEVKSIV